MINSMRDVNTEILPVIADVCFDIIKMYAPINVKPVFVDNQSWMVGSSTILESVM